MNPLIIISIIQSIASGFVSSKGDSAKVSEWVGYLNLLRALIQRWTVGSADLQLLDNQLQAAVAGNRGLTSDERSAWRRRDDIATEIATEWLKDHPKP